MRSPVVTETRRHGSFGSGKSSQRELVMASLIRCPTKHAPIKNGMGKANGRRA